MRKFFTLLTVFVALSCLTSCNLDKVATYTFSYQVSGSITDEDDRETLSNYLKETYLNENMVFSFTGKSSEVMEKALARMEKDISEADDDYIYSFLKYEEDFVELDGVLSGDKSNNLIGWRIWSYDQINPSLIE